MNILHHVKLQARECYILKTLLSEIRSLRNEVASLKAENIRLQAENIHLKEQLRLNSKNSSKPPSSDSKKAVMILPRKKAEPSQAILATGVRFFRGRRSMHSLS